MSRTSRLSLALLLCVALPALANPDQLLDKLVRGRTPGCVFDYANLVSADDEQAITSLLLELEEKTTAEVKVVALRSLEGGEIEDFSTRLFERWGIGKKGKDNGVLFLVAYEDRRARIEVGYGLEPVITDSQAGTILDTYVMPPFRSGNTSAGIRKGAEAIAGAVAKSAGVTLQALPVAPPTQAPKLGHSDSPSILEIIIVIAIIILFIRHPFLALMLFSGGGRGGGWSGGGFGGGGGGGFGGGMSGGGGASRSW